MPPPRGIGVEGQSQNPPARRGLSGMALRDNVKKPVNQKGVNKGDISATIVKPRALWQGTG